MLAIKEIKIPDIGGATDVEVIEISVAPGDKVKKETSLLTLEGEKATIEIPSPYEGIIKDIKIKVGDKVSEGSLILTMEIEEAAESKAEPLKTTQEKAKENPSEKPKEKSSSQLKEIQVPDIGGASNVEVVEINVAAGEQIKKEATIITLEGEKATMEIPSPVDGQVKEIKLKVGDKVSQGDLILIMETLEQQTSEPVEKPKAEEKSKVVEAKSTPSPVSAAAIQDYADVHAGPSVRRIAREFGVDLVRIKGSGPKQRILKEDIQAFVKAELQKAKNLSAGGGFSIPTAPVIDFAKFGSIEVKPLNKIKRYTGINVHRSWITVPHVTQFEEADITEMEKFRKEQKAAAEAEGVKLTPLVFIMKAVVAALKEFPIFNSSLDATGENLIYKKYYNIGIAADTPNGLVVPVIRDVDCKTVLELAKELGVISAKAREKGLTPAEMSGSCFTISSLGGIGGTAFTPIVNTPDVAILGVSKASIKPVYQEEKFVPRLMLPLSLSYDHRVVDGADGARFIVYIAKCLQDIRLSL